MATKTTTKPEAAPKPDSADLHRIAHIEALLASRPDLGALASRRPDPSAGRIPPVATIVAAYAAAYADALR
jgi:hypothetical protein